MLGGRRGGIRVVEKGGGGVEMVEKGGGNGGG